MVGFDDGSPLHHAVERNNITAVKILLFHKAKPNLKDSEGNTPVLIAAMQDEAPRSIQILKSLAQAGADLDMVDCSGYTPFGCCRDRHILVYLMDSVWLRLSLQEVVEKNYREII